MRYVLLDRITALEPPARARGVKCVSLSDDVFVDHFPGHPVMPGALTLEALAQLGGVLCEATMRLAVNGGRNDLHALLVAVERAKFRRLVRPGDRLELEVTAGHVGENGGRGAGTGPGDSPPGAEGGVAVALARGEPPR